MCSASVSRFNDRSARLGGGDIFKAVGAGDSLAYIQYRIINCRQRERHTTAGPMVEWRWLFGKEAGDIPFGDPAGLGVGVGNSSAPLKSPHVQGLVGYSLLSRRRYERAKGLVTGLGLCAEPYLRCPPLLRRVGIIEYVWVDVC